MLAKDKRRFQRFRVNVYESTFGLYSGDDQAIAQLDLETCEALQCLASYPGATATAIVETSELRQLRAKGNSKGRFLLSINIYGPRRHAEEIGDRLSRVHAYLQHPIFLEPEYDYFNPQCFRAGGEMKCMTHLVGLNDDDYRAKAISDDIRRVLDSLDTMTQNDSDLVGDSQPDTVTTPLKR